MSELEQNLSGASFKKCIKAKRPKRNISAFHIFSKELHAEFNEATERVNPNKRMTIISERWQNLSEKEKQAYAEKAKMDKWRYLNELNEFLAQEGIEQSELKKKPKKFGNAFTFYLRDKKEQARLEYPDLSMAEIMTVIAKQWKDAPLAEKEKYTQISEEDKKRYQQEIHDISESSMPAKMSKKTKMLKNAQKLEKTIDELIQQSLETTSNKINLFKQKMIEKQLDQSSEILEEFSKAIKIPLEFLKKNSREQSTATPKPAKRVHIESAAEPKLNLVGSVPSSTQLYPSSRQTSKFEDFSFLMPQFDGNNNSFEKVKITYPLLSNSREASTKETVFYVKGFNFRNDSIGQEPFVERNKSDIFTDFINGSLNKEFNPSFLQNRQISDMFGDFGLDRKNSSTEDNSSVNHSSNCDGMIAEEKTEEDIVREPAAISGNSKRRCFNAVVSDAITMDSSFLGLNELMTFDSLMN